MLRIHPFKITNETIWNYCLEHLKGKHLDILYLQQLSWLFTNERWKCDLKHMLQLYDDSAHLPQQTRNSLHNVFLDAFSRCSYPLTDSERERLYKLQKNAITSRDAGRLSYLAKLAQSKATEETRLQQVQLLDDVVTLCGKLRDNSLGQQLKSAILANLPSKPSATDADFNPNHEMRIAHIQAATIMYWQLPKQRRYLRNLEGFYHFIVQELKDNKLTPEETKAALDALITYQSNPEVVLNTLIRLDNMQLARKFADTLLQTQIPNKLYAIASAADSSSSPKATQLYFQVIGSAMLLDKTKFITAIKQCKTDTLRELEDFFVALHTAAPTKATAFYFDLKHHVKYAQKLMIHHPSATHSGSSSAAIMRGAGMVNRISVPASPPAAHDVSAMLPVLPAVAPQSPVSKLFTIHPFPMSKGDENAEMLSTSPKNGA